MRRTKLTPEVQEDVVAAIEIGATYTAAAANAGIAYSTLRLWITQGEEAIKKFEAREKLTAKEKQKIAFVQAIEDAKGMALLNWQQIVHKAVKNDPMWAWRMLQVRAPEEYTPNNKMEMTGKEGPVVINLTWGDVGDDVAAQS